MEITSPAFDNDALMPHRFAVEGGDVSPPLTWAGVPEGAKSLVLIVEDIDIPIPLKKTWVHWIVYDIPPTSPGLPEGIAHAASVPGGGTQGRTSYLGRGWGGPNPVGGVHRYIFQLCALDINLGIPARMAGLSRIRTLMRGHVLVEARLTGRYKKQRL